MKIRFIALSLFLQAVAFAGFIELTDTEGRTIRAEPVGITDGNLTVSLENGQRSTFPISRLSLESIERVTKELAVSTPKPAGATAPKKPSPSGAALGTAFTFNGEPPSKMEIRFANASSENRGRPLVATADPQSGSIDMADVKDGDYYLTLMPEGYAQQVLKVSVRKGKPVPATVSASFRKKRYAVIRYAVNLSGKADFSPAAAADIETGTAAFTDQSRATAKHFLGFKLLQAPSASKYTGDTFVLNWSWVTKGGVNIRRGSFDSILAATRDPYETTELNLKKGLVFTCRSTYSRNPFYAKFEVIDILDEAPGDLIVY